MNTPFTTRSRSRTTGPSGDQRRRHRLAADAEHPVRRYGHRVCTQGGGSLTVRSGHRGRPDRVNDDDGPRDQRNAGTSRRRSLTRPIRSSATTRLSSRPRSRLARHVRRHEHERLGSRIAAAGDHRREPEHWSARHDRVQHRRRRTADDHARVCAAKHHGQHFHQRGRRRPTRTARRSSS